MVKLLVKFFLIFCAFWCHRTQAQHAPSLSAKGAFLFPINPGSAVSIWGNMGEIRPNHFHGGIDIPTQRRTGLPVYACKEGYISRVMVSGDGYGNCLMMTHPDGYVTLYAHLEKFSEPLHTFIRKLQYEKKSFDLNYYPEKNQFSFRQGDTIALSGNTGRSAGPHLHFEIRDTANTVYNPMTFGFAEISDARSPVVKKLSIVPLSMDARIHKRFDWFDVPLKEGGDGVYSAIKPIEVSGLIGLELSALDRVGEGTSSGGIYSIRVFLNKKQIYAHTMDQFPFACSNHVNQLVNFRRMHRKSEKLQKLYCPDGYFNTSSVPAEERGKILLQPGESATIEILLSDVHGNKRSCRFNLSGKEFPPEIQTLGKTPTSIRHEVTDHILMLQCNGDPVGGKLRLYSGGRETRLPSVQVQEGQLLYLYDLRRGMPDSAVASASCRKIFAFQGMFVPGKEHQVSLEDFSITISKNGLFDTLFLDLEKESAGIFRVNSGSTPLSEALSLAMPLPEDDLNEKLLPCSDFNSSGFAKTLPVDSREGSIIFKSKNLGRFRLKHDTIAPEIKLLRLDSTSARFEIRDRFSDVHQVEASINGQWILMASDKKKGLMYADPWPSQLPFKGEFLLRVSDKAGNVRIFRRQI
jgi:hypothetical protein